MTIVRAGLVALVLTSGCLRFGYAATDSDSKPDASKHDSGAQSTDGGMHDAAISSNASMDASAVQHDAAYNGSAADAAAASGGSSAVADSGPGQADATPGDDDAGSDVPAIIDTNPSIGDTGLRVNDILGYYNSPTWGDMVLQAHGAEIWVTYPLNDGTIIGDFTSAGVLAGWWTETPSRVGRNAGEVELRFSRANATIHLEGRWRYQTSGNWFASWSLDLVTDRGPPSALVDAFNNTQNFMRHP